MMSEHFVAARAEQPRTAGILIVNAVASNTGDAAILMGLIDSLRLAFGTDVRIQVADDHPAAARRLYPDIEFVPGLHAAVAGSGVRWSRLRRSIRRRRIGVAVRLMPLWPAAALALLDRGGREHARLVSESDVVISTGGTYLVEHYRHTLRRRLEQLALADALRRPIFLYTQSIGSFHRRGVRRSMAHVLRRARRIYVRDARSRKHLLDIGIPSERVRHAADAAFALAPVRGAATAGAKRREDGRLRVAVSVREWSHFGERSRPAGLSAYRAAIADAVRFLCARGAEVVFVSTCQGVPDYWTDDSRFARALVDELLTDVEAVTVDSAFRAPAALLEFLGGFDLAIATRMHFAILALCARIPVVPIAYEFKTSELFTEMGMGEVSVDIGAIRGDALVHRVQRVLAERESIAARLEEVLPELRERAIQPAREIRLDAAVPRSVT